MYIEIVIVLALTNPVVCALSSGIFQRSQSSSQVVFTTGFNYERHSLACPDYKHFATIEHQPFSEGPLARPFQRPSMMCRTYSSSAVEETINRLTDKMIDKDLARLFENAFPNTLDTTVRWHSDPKQKNPSEDSDKAWTGPQTFIVTGDINAEWLRDSTNQLAQYQSLAKTDQSLEILILGAINTQSEYVIDAPYCNAFQPPPHSGAPIPNNGQDDFVHPIYEPTRVFECKYELDSLAHFLALGNQFHNVTGSTAFLTPRFYRALKTILSVLDEQSQPTFDQATGQFRRNEYTFRRKTVVGTETLNLAGVGNPLGPGTGLIRSAFRPSDDATIFGFLIPANAQMSVELMRASTILSRVGQLKLAADCRERSESIRKGIFEHGVVSHKIYGRVFAFEVDGYGSSLLMDDANIPSLLSLPMLGFVGRDNEIYQNTRKMILARQGNPYFLEGKDFSGIGGPHVGPSHAWPMSRAVQIMTSDNDTEIITALKAIRNVSRLGLVNEGVNVWRASDYSRPWFAWANSVFSQAVLDVAHRKPHLLFGPGAKPFEI